MKEFSEHADLNEDQRLQILFIAFELDSLSDHCVQLSNELPLTNVDEPTISRVRLGLGGLKEEFQALAGKFEALKLQVSGDPDPNFAGS